MNRLHGRRRLLVLGLALTPSLVAAQRSAPASQSDTSHVGPHRIGVMLGLGQWALGGANIATQASFGWLALEYSHGQGVPLPNTLLNASEKAAGATGRLAWTTGLGVGAHLTRDLRLLVEAKAHHYEFSGGDRNSRQNYTVYSVGPGVFYDIHVGSHLYLQPSLRWWPTVGGTMTEGATLRRADGVAVPLRQHDSGVFPNVSLGWTF